MVWLTSLLYLRYSRRFSPLKTFRVNGTAFPTCLILEVTSTSAENLKHASNQHIFKTPSPWNWNVSLGPIRSPPPQNRVLFTKPSCTVPIHLLTQPLGSFSVLPISISLSQKKTHLKGESVSIFLFITIKFLIY